MKSPTHIPILVALLIGTIVAISVPNGTLAFAQVDGCQPNPSPVDAADPDVIVDSPELGDSLISPLVVTGQARTFEGTVQVALFDSDGQEIASTFGLAAAEEIGQLGPFSIQLEFTVTEPTGACLWVYEQSAETGGPSNVVQVPLTLQTANLPATGAEGGSGGSNALVPVLIVLGLIGTAVGVASWRFRRA